MQKYVIITAAGRGLRMNASIPKQFLLLGGTPLLMHAVTAFKRTCPGISVIVVLDNEYQTAWKNLCDKHNFRFPVQWVAGGQERFHSVRNGLKKIIQEEALVAVHDGVRPLVSDELIRNVFEAAQDYGAAVPVIPVDESLRRMNGEKNTAVDRREFYLVQTPQCFRASWLRRAYSLADEKTNYSDDASVVESAGYSIHLIKGERRNIKITFPEDMRMAEAFLPRTCVS